MSTTSPLRSARWAAPILVLVLALAVGGCGIFSPDEDKGTPPPDNGGEYPAAENPDILMSNFIRAYQEQKIAEYEKIIHPQFQFFFSEKDLDELFGGSEPDWNWERETQATRKMFEGQTGVDPVSGDPIPPILDITLTLLPQNDWEDASGVGPLYEGTFRRLYKVSMMVTYQASDLTTRVTGDNMFYITRNDDDLFQIKFWEDLGTDTGG
jgi:hypothetical protein